MVVGQTLATKPEDIYRALIGATAFGTRTIVDAFNEAGVPVREFIVAGGLIKNALLMQIYADVLNMPLTVVSSEQAPALGSAIHAAVAAGAYPRRRGRLRGDGQGRQECLHTHPGQRRRLRSVVRRVHHFARLLRRGVNDVMHRLRGLRRAALDRSTATSIER
jgi:L-ribulokinase